MKTGISNLFCLVVVCDEPFEFSICACEKTCNHVADDKFRYVKFFSVPINQIVFPVVSVISQHKYVELHSFLKYVNTWPYL